jgi:pimeloyl-ACP methyl ester carboxylesterase
VLLHGFPEFWWTWRRQLPVLADAGFHAVAVDLRGYGDSDKPPRGYDLWTLAGDVAGLIRALGEPSARIVGHGWGGMIGWTVTALHPRVVAALAVLGAPHPLAVRRAVVRDPAGQGRALLGGRGRVLAAQVPRRAERWLRTDESAHVERLMRQRAGAAWIDTDDFTVSVEGNRRAMRVAGVAHSALEYYRWAVWSRYGPGPTVPGGRRPPADGGVVAAGHGATTCTDREHRRGVPALGRACTCGRAAPGWVTPARGARAATASLPLTSPALSASARAAPAAPGWASWHRHRRPSWPRVRNSAP